MKCSETKKEAESFISCEAKQDERQMENLENKQKKKKPRKIGSKT